MKPGSTLKGDQQLHSPGIGLGWRMAFSTSEERQRSWLVPTAGLILFSLVVVLDYITGPVFSIALFYASVVMLVGFFGDGLQAQVFALLCAVAWATVNWEGHSFGGGWGYAWASMSRYLTFVLFGVGGAAVRARHEADQQRIRALERAKDLEQEITRISEHEQRRIGQDLHDGICQVLAAIRCAASSVRDDLETKEAPEAAVVGEIADMLRDTIMETRNLARGIFPAQMEAAGLPAVLEELAENIGRLHRLKVSFEARGEIKVADPEAAMHLYRIAQEAVSNAVKHSKAAHVAIQLIHAGSTLVLTVADDGGGMPEAAAGSEGMGLKTMRYRATLIGATLEVTNRPGGVTILCQVPVEKLGGAA